MVKIARSLIVAGHWIVGFYLITASICMILLAKEKLFPPPATEVTVTIPGETFVEQVAQSSYEFKQDEKGNCTLRLKHGK